MSKLKLRTQPDLSLISEAHQQALIDDHDFSLWTRNVMDHFKDLPDQEIKKRLKETAFPYAVCFENWEGSFTMASGMRNANAFNAREIFYLGDKRFDSRGSVGVCNYSDVHWISSIDQLIKLKETYVFVGVDNIAGAAPLSTHTWHKNSLMIFGSESAGLTLTMRALCDQMIYIPQFGSVRSLNAAVASGIIMNDFISKYQKVS